MRRKVSFMKQKDEYFRISQKLQIHFREATTEERKRIRKQIRIERRKEVVRLFMAYFFAVLVSLAGLALLARWAGNLISSV